MGKKTIAMAAVTGMALAGLAEASPVVAEPATTGTSMSADRPEAPAAEAVKRLVEQFLDFVGRLDSISKLTPAHVESGLHITLKKNENGEIYRSPDLGGGWLYGVELLKARPHMKTGLAFGFYNYDRGADPSAVCAISLDQVRASLTSHGYVENITPGEHGQIVAWNFVKSDIVTDADAVRKMLKKAGYVEKESVGEIGNFLGWDYIRDNIVISLVPQATAARNGESHLCIRSIRTTG